MTRPLRWLMLGTGGITVPLLLLLLALLLVIATEAGSRWLIDRALPYIPGEVGAQKIEGTLLRGLALDGFYYRREGMEVDIASLRARWNLRDLMSGRFVVRSLRVRDIDIALSDTGSEEAPPPTRRGPWPDLGIGMPLRIADAEILDIHVRKPDGAFDIERLDLSASQGPINTRIAWLRVRHREFSLALEGKARNLPPYALDMRLDLEANLPADFAGGDAGDSAPAAQRFSGRLWIHGDLEKPAFELAATEPVQVSVDGSLETGFDAAVLSLDPKRLRLVSALHWSRQPVPSGWLPVPVETRGKLSLEGGLDDYRAAIETRLAAEAYPPVTLQLDLAGDRDGARIRDLNIHSEAGKLQGGGRVGWRDLFDWDLDLDAVALNPGTLLPDWSGYINSRLHTSGRLAGDGLQAQVNIESLSGTLRQYSLLASGLLQYRAGRVGAEDLHLVIDQNRLDLSGLLALGGEGGAPLQQAPQKLQWRLEAGNLAALLPGLSGEVRSAGRLTGTLAAPVVQAELDAEAVRYRDYRLAGLYLLMRPDPAQGGRQHLSLQASGVDAPGLAGADLSLDWRGKPEDHRLRLQVDAGIYKAELAASGGWRQQLWTGSLLEAALEQPAAGRWHLHEPADLALSAESASLSSSCWRQLPPSGLATPAGHVEPGDPAPSSGDGPDRQSRALVPGKLCLDLAWSTAAGIETSGQLQALDLALIQPWLPSATELHSSLSGSFDLGGPPSALRGGIRLQASPGKFLHYAGDGEIDRYGFDGLDFDGVVDPERWDGEVQFRLTGDGRLSSRLAYRPGTGDLAGDLAIDFSNLAWLEIFAPNLDDLAGSFEAQLQVAGSLSQPDITGRMQMKGLSAQVPELAIRLADGQLDLSRTGNDPWQLSGSLRSGKGAIKLAGLLDWQWASPWQASLRVTGKDFQIVDLPEMTARANPDVEIQASTEELRLNGELQIPVANVTVKKLPESAVTVSDDVVIVDKPADGQASTEARANGRYRIFSNLRLKLGDDVKFSGFGINAGLAGSLQLQEQPEKPTQVEGEVAIREGSYKAYGQLFEIEEGRLIFRGPPENPGLWIRAVRYYEDTKVGVIIRGTVKALRSEVFSEPAMPASEAMAILITGKPLESANKSDANRLANAATALGISQSKYITERLQRSFGLDVVKLSSEAGLEESSLTIGKYLSPRLYISYAKDLFGQGSLVNLDYRIGRRLKLRAEAGSAQAVDILYSFDR